MNFFITKCRFWIQPEVTTTALKTALAEKLLSDQKSGNDQFYFVSDFSENFLPLPNYFIQKK